MKKIKLKESDIENLVKKIIKEDTQSRVGKTYPSNTIEDLEQMLISVHETKNKVNYALQTVEFNSDDLPEEIRWVIEDRSSDLYNSLDDSLSNCYVLEEAINGAIDSLTHGDDVDTDYR